MKSTVSKKPRKPTAKSSPKSNSKASPKSNSKASPKRNDKAGKPVHARDAKKPFEDRKPKEESKFGRKPPYGKSGSFDKKEGGSYARKPSSASPKTYEKREETTFEKRDEKRTYKPQAAAGKRSPRLDRQNLKEKPEGFSRPAEKEKTERFSRPATKENIGGFPRTRSTEKTPDFSRNRSPEKSQSFSLASRLKKMEKFSIWGKRPVEAILQDLSSQAEPSFKVADISIHLIQDKQKKVPAQLKTCVELSQVLGIKIHLHENQDTETWPLPADDGINHQRVCLLLPKFPLKDLHDAIEICKEAKESQTKGCVGIVLDQVQDPRNFGSIVRTAAFFGAKFVVFGSDRQAELSPLVVRTSAGGAFQTQMIATPNLNRALSLLKDAGAWIVGADGSSKQSYSALSIDRPFVLVVANEATGLRHEIKRNCDFCVAIPGGNATLDSLNVGVATGILLAKLSPEGGIVDSDTDAFEPVDELEEMMDRR